MGFEHDYPIPSNDQARGRLMDKMALSSRGDDPFFNHMIASAKRIFDAPVAFLSLISGERQEFLAIDGVDMTETPRSSSMCAYTVAARVPIISADTHDDPRFRDHPIVANPPHLRFSASVPIILSNGFCVGTLCAVDMKPHDPPTQTQIDQLTDLAAMAARFYEVPSEPDPQLVKDMQAIVTKAQDEFLALIGHELRTPLNGIVGLSHCLGATTPDDQDIVTAMQDTAGHLNDLIGSILAFTELSSGDIQLSEKSSDLVKILRRAEKGVSQIFTLQGKSVDMSLPSELRLDCDPAMLELAITCLIDNVCKHGGTQSHVGCGMDAEGRAWVRVCDNGKGIAEERLDAIWHAFSVGEDVNRRNSDGLGLGLPLTRRIVELHGGRLTLEQSGTGVDVMVTLPAWRIKPVASSAA